MNECKPLNPGLALAEVRRVLRPTGRALLIEHSKSVENPLLGAYQVWAFALFQGTSNSGRQFLRN